MEAMALSAITAMRYGNTDTGNQATKPQQGIGNIVKAVAGIASIFIGVALLANVIKNKNSRRG